jgi:hypothetical protein
LEDLHRQAKTLAAGEATSLKDLIVKASTKDLIRQKKKDSRR